MNEIGTTFKQDSPSVDKMALLAGYYTYRNFDPNDIVSEVIGSNFTNDRLIEKKNSVHIHLRFNNKSIKYVFIKANYNEIDPKSSNKKEIDFVIYPRKLEIFIRGMKELDLKKLSDLGGEVMLEELCFFDRNFGYILIKDGAYETPPIRANYLCSWFNMIYPLMRTISKKDRRQKLLMYEKLITYNLRLELLA